MKLASNPYAYRILSPGLDNSTWKLDSGQDQELSTGTRQLLDRILDSYSTG
jgi:hypothetical protein